MNAFSSVELQRITVEEDVEMLNISVDGFTFNLVGMEVGILIVCYCMLA